MPDNVFERAIAALSPAWASRRARDRRVLAYYEAAAPGQTRKGRRETANGNDAVLRAGASLRQQARHLEQNHDIALGVLNALVANTIGATGITIEPQPRRADGSIDAEFSKQILDLYKDWCRRPEVTWMHDWPSAQRMMARTWFRDGEVFGQLVEGTAAWIDHGTKVPLSIEMMEPDFVPMDFQSMSPVISQGIEINSWGRAVGYWVYKNDPTGVSGLITSAGMKRIEAARIVHLANRHRIRQLRGVSVFASVLGRLDDLKDYEESERIAAKVAASMAAFIKKGTPELYEAGDSEQRAIKFRPGMVFDDLRPGEDIGTIDTNRPNPNLETYRSGQLKAVASGTGPTYSSISKTYDGTYSAQRQELVEGWVAYAALQSEFTARIVRPVYERFIALAIVSGQLKPPAGMVRDSLDDAIYIGPQMPWIDPQREAEAWAILEDRAYASGPEIVRRRGANPLEVLDQQKRWREEKLTRDIPDPTSKTQPANRRTP